jgi:hypothetical protein
MAVPDVDQLRNWARNYVDLWNSGDKEAWAANWRSVAPGDFRMLDPVGTPEKHGFEECCSKSYDLFQPNVRFEILEGTLFICANEVAWTLKNHIRNDGRDTVAYSIETYRFESDGSVIIRTYYRVPPHGDDTIGTMFKEYLPEGG